MAVVWKRIDKLPKRGARKGFIRLFRFAEVTNPGRRYTDLPVAYQVGNQHMGSRVCTHWVDVPVPNEKQLWDDAVSTIDTKMNRGSNAA